MIGSSRRLRVFARCQSTDLRKGFSGLHGLRPCYQALHEAILDEPVLGLDETGWKLMGSDGRDYRAVIAMSSPGASIFHIADGKSTEVLRPLLDPFSGTIVVDGYKPYLAIVKERNDLLLANCWAHAVRRFKDAAKDFPIAEIPLKLIGKLYKIDRRAGPFPGDEEVMRRRQRLRKKESAVVLRSLRRWLMEQLPKIPKSTNLGNAIAYTLAHWQGLIVFVDDPKVPLDNNGTERDLRQVVSLRPYCTPWSIIWKQRELRFGGCATRSSSERQCLSHAVAS